MRRVSRVSHVIPRGGNDQVDNKQLVIGAEGWEQTSPFLFLSEDWFSPPGGFEEHPHRGMQTVTVVLEGAMASVAGVGAQQYPFFPVRLIMRNPFESTRKVDRVHAPMLFLHSPEDTIIPYELGRRIFDAARPPKGFVDVRGWHIFANEVDRAAFFGAIRSFLDEYGLLGHQE